MLSLTSIIRTTIFLYFIRLLKNSFPVSKMQSFAPYLTLIWTKVLLHNENILHTSNSLLLLTSFHLYPGSRSVNLQTLVRHRSYLVLFLVVDELILCISSSSCAYIFLYILTLKIKSDPNLYLEKHRILKTYNS